MTASFPADGPFPLPPERAGGSAGASDPNDIVWSELSVPRLLALSSAVSFGENLLFYPFHLLKTREQTDVRRISQSFYQATKEQFQQAVRKDGVRGLYRGFWAASLTALPANGIYLMSYLWSKHLLGWNALETNTWQRTYIPSVSGVAAEASALPVWVPSDVIVQRLQMANSTYKGFWDCVSTTWRTEGIRGMYTGVGATLVFCALDSAAWWVAYEHSKKVFAPPPRADGTEAEPNRLAQVFSGALAGAITTTVTNPLDVVKTRLQTQVVMDFTAAHPPPPPPPPPSLSTSPAGSSVTSAGTAQQEGSGGSRPRLIEKTLKPQKHYSGFLQAFGVIWREEGSRAFFKGLLPKVASRAPLSGLSSLVYEFTLSYSRKNRDS